MLRHWSQTLGGLGRPSGTTEGILGREDRGRQEETGSPSAVQAGLKLIIVLPQLLGVQMGTSMPKTEGFLPVPDTCLVVVREAQWGGTTKKTGPLRSPGHRGSGVTMSLWRKELGFQRLLSLLCVHPSVFLSVSGN